MRRAADNIPQLICYEAAAVGCHQWLLIASDCRDHTLVTGHRAVTRHTEVTEQQERQEYKIDRTRRVTEQEERQNKKSDRTTRVAEQE